jgi:hypothetical protein
MPVAKQKAIALPGEPEPVLPPTTRLNLNLSKQARHKLDELCEQTGETITEAVRRSLDLRVYMHECGLRGERVVIVSPDNSMRELVMSRF